MKCKVCGGDTIEQTTCCNEKRGGKTKVFVCIKCRTRNYPPKE